MPRINKHNWDKGYDAKHPEANEQHEASYWGRRLEKAYPPDRNLPDPTSHQGHRNLHAPDRLVFDITCENLGNFNNSPLSDLKGKIVWGRLCLTRAPIIEEGEARVSFNVWVNSTDPVWLTDIFIDPITRAEYNADRFTNRQTTRVISDGHRIFGVDDVLTVECIGNGTNANVGSGTFMIGGHFE